MWRLLWELEGYLDPVAPSLYPLDTPALRLAVQLGALEGNPPLPDILERGLGERPPDLLLERLVGEPTIRLIPGPVLEFTHPEELKALRGYPGWRRELDRLLSSRHVALNPWRVQPILSKLLRQGLISERDLPSPHSHTIGRRNLGKGHLSKSDSVYLLSLMLLAEGLQNIAAPPPGLLARLTENMDHPLRAAAARKATAMLAQIRPEPAWKPEFEPPLLPPEELVRAIQEAIDRDESIDVLYKASGRHAAEYRHLTPLLVESRGERFYLIAYCHMRRANRTFRLDRLKLIDLPPI